MKSTHNEFQIILGDPIPQDVKVVTRTGVRAIIWSGQDLLMMKSNRGDYKFPRGGVEAGESDKQALARELLEETGYTDFVIRELAGQAIQTDPDRIEKGAWYHLRSH
ncbi:NUDIX hydrolase [Chryseomicrobium imtechense]